MSENEQLDTFLCRYTDLFINWQMSVLIVKVFHNTNMNETSLHASDGAEAPGVKDVWDLNHHTLCMKEVAFSQNVPKCKCEFVFVLGMCMFNMAVHICNYHFCGG